MSNHFVAIDVETANADSASICQVGLVIFEHGVEQSSWSTLVDPEDYFSSINVSIHGIDEEHVLGAPKFPDIEHELRESLTGAIVVSHMPFDRVALTRVCAKYGLPAMECRWLDSARVTRRAWPQFSRKGYGLANIASWLGIEFEHHDAENDARAAGHVLLHAMEESGLTVDEWLIRANQRSRSSVQREGNVEGHLAGEVVVFTGALSIPRREAADMAAKVGCDVAPRVTQKVTLLVVGDQDVRKLGGKSKSSKHQKAEKLIAAGQPIRIITESDFRALVEE